MTNAERQRKVTEALGNYLAEHLEKNGPVTALFRPYSLRFEVYGSENEGVMKLTYKAAGEVGLQLGVYRKGTDRLYSHYLPAAAVEEMVRYLRDPQSHQDWLQSISHLSESVDDYWD